MFTVLRIQYNKFQGKLHNIQVAGKGNMATIGSEMRP